jgi:hypothetical protein
LTTAKHVHARLFLNLEVVDLALVIIPQTLFKTSTSNLSSTKHKLLSWVCTRNKPTHGFLGRYSRPPADLAPQLPAAPNVNATTSRPSRSSPTRSHATSSHLYRRDGGNRSIDMHSPGAVGKIVKGCVVRCFASS